MKFFTPALLLVLSSCRFAGICTGSAAKCAEEEAQWNNDDVVVGGSCSGASVRGNWTGGGSETLYFKHDCTFSSVAYPTCGNISGTYSSNDAETPFTLTVTSIGTTGEDCRAGTYSCVSTFTGVDESRELDLRCTLSGAEDTLKFLNFNFRSADPDPSTLGNFDP